LRDSVEKKQRRVPTRFFALKTKLLSEETAVGVDLYEQTAFADTYYSLNGGFITVTASKTG